MSKKVRFGGLLLLACSIAWAQSSKLSPDLVALDPHSSAKVIVEWKDPPAVAPTTTNLYESGPLESWRSAAGRYCH